MNLLAGKPLVYTIKDRCKVCFTCVRECPAKAIRIHNGQAEVLNERCIGCGNCVKVCSQGAKAYRDSKEGVRRLIRSGEPVAAIVAPSFVAEFAETERPEQFVGMLRTLGFTTVHEVAFGADAIALQYKELMSKAGLNESHISSDCPAIVNYVRQYYPELTEKLAPVVSPMVAATRILRQKFGVTLNVVFIGPCIAKKVESEEITAALTFAELREMLEEAGIRPEETEPVPFDPPLAGKGAIFPVARGMLYTLDEKEDIVSGSSIVAEGRSAFPDAIREFANGHLKTCHLELLCCEGCIMGPGMSKNGKRYIRQARVGAYVREKLAGMSDEEWKNEIEATRGTDFSRSFEPVDCRIPAPDNEAVKEVLKRMGKNTESDHLNCGACGYATCTEHAVAIVEGLAESEMCLPYTIEKLHHLIDELNRSNDELASTRQALKQSEKLASMGQLSAGIAHELNNPLGVITMYANILRDETPEDHPIRADLDLIVEQADRCKHIVGGLLNFARKNQVRPEETDLVQFVKNSLRSVIIPENIRVSFRSSHDRLVCAIDTDQMMQVLTNLEKNAVEAMPGGGELSVELNAVDNGVEIQIADTGIGIPEENKEKLFTPFFTTKKMGKGTGLGLPLVYGIVKMHRGKIRVESNANPENGPTGTTFIIWLPQNLIK